MSTTNDLAKRIRRSNKAYFAAGMEAGKQKVVDLFFVAAHELGMLKSPAKAKELLDKMEQLVILPCILPELEVVPSLEKTERGENGFGSSGR